jgi:hypothetical protein
MCVGAVHRSLNLLFARKNCQHLTEAVRTVSEGVMIPVTIAMHSVLTLKRPLATLFAYNAPPTYPPTEPTPPKPNKQRLLCALLR